MGIFNFGGVSKYQYNKVAAYCDILFKIAVYNRILLLYVNNADIQDIVKPEDVSKRVFAELALYEIEDLKEFLKGVNETAEELLNKMQFEANARKAVEKLFPKG